VQKASRIFIFSQILGGAMQGRKRVRQKTEGAIVSCVAPPAQFQGFMRCFP